MCKHDNLSENPGVDLSSDWQRFETIMGNIGNVKPNSRLAK